MRVIEEYRRFLLLGVAAGHPVSPSDAVDQVWHLHLTYTKSYWEGLCQGVLGRPFHHVPSEGRPGEGEKYADWYRQTLASYRRIFGEEPPGDIWPRRPVAGDRPASRHQWIDRGRHWVIRRPRQLLWWSGVGVAVAALGLVGGCQEQFIRGSVLDLPGPEFLRFYALLLSGMLLLSVIIKWILRAPGAGGGVVTDDPYLWSWLSGGAGRSVLAALANLAKARAITVSSAGSVRLDAQVPHDLHPFEAAIVDSVRRKRDTVEALTADALDYGAPIEAELVQDGLLLSDAARARAFWGGLLVGLVPVMVGTVKLFIGLGRDKPVGILAALLFFSVLLVFLVHRRPLRRSRRGDAMLRRLRREHRALKSQAGFGQGEVNVAVALFGTGMLAGTMLATVHELRRVAPDAGGGAGWWFGGCGSSCGGGGGGGGCGGGGCGGCGGD